MFYGVAINAIRQDCLTPRLVRDVFIADVLRRRILDAAFAVFTSRGYAQASTLEIATRAKVSKRELYALIGKKEDMLVARSEMQATRLKWPREIPPPGDLETLTAALERFGYQLLREVTDPTVVSVFRLAIAEAERAPEVARTLDDVGRATPRDALTDLFASAKASGLVQADTQEMARRFSALLWGDLMLGLLLRVVERPSEEVLKRRAQQATHAFMQLYLRAND